MGDAGRQAPNVFRFRELGEASRPTTQRGRTEPIVVLAASFSGSFRFRHRLLDEQ
jgi:hypothetical protein